MFGLVLAIGLLVDDAIVVVENVERVMSEEGLSPKEATRKSMEQITGALVGIALVLSAVFVPMAFFGGSVGVIYRQFSITIVSSMALSVLVALIAHAGAVRDDPEAGREGARHARSGLLRLVQPQLRRAAAGATSAVVGVLLRRRGRGMIGYARRSSRVLALLFVPPADRLPARRRTRALMYVPGACCPPGSTLETHAARCWRRSRTTSSTRRRTRSSR